MTENASQNAPQGPSGGNPGHHTDFLQELARGLAAAVFPFLIREVTQLVKGWIGQGGSGPSSPDQPAPPPAADTTP